MGIHRLVAGIVFTLGFVIPRLLKDIGQNNR
jgi:hypothetical protein